MKFPEKPTAEVVEKQARNPVSTEDLFWGFGARTCESCQAVHESKYANSVRSERFEGPPYEGSRTTRRDFWCDACEAYLGVDTDWDGPTPVRTHSGWELH